MKAQLITSAVCLLLIAGQCLVYVQGGSLYADQMEELAYMHDVLDGEITKEQLHKCHGMDPDTCQLHRDLMREVRQRVSMVTGQPAANVTDDDERVDTCMLLTVEQLEVLLNSLDSLLNTSSPRANNRKKRGLLDFRKQPYYMWNMPIQYRFDGEHDENERRIIRSAAQHWMDNTCVRFDEVSGHVIPSSEHILITKQDSGCYSYLGNVGLGLRTSYQQLNLGVSCLSLFGIPVHEFGHALGLVHQQSRSDRDKWITVVLENVVMNHVTDFLSNRVTDPLGVPYDYSSIMQYSSLGGASKNAMHTMLAKNPLYQMNMGQRTGLSFNDIRLINKAYCSDSCSSKPLTRPCQHGGYQNPNDCSRCHCPDGLGGDFCEQVAPSRNAQCGGEIRISKSSDRRTIMTPGYRNAYYNSYQECSWWFKAPVGYNLQLTFDGEFGLYCRSTACYHWVEIKYKADIGLEGARFCCYQRPNVTITSESNEMLVVFKSNISINDYRSRRGFSAQVSIVKANSANGGGAPPSSGVNWQCSFEPVPSGGDTFCGMIQDPSDDFDWTLNKGPTPSVRTGPDYAADKNYYIFIEASSPRRPNDQARLIFPDFKGYTGDACVKFAFHMLGSYVGNLQLVEFNKSTSHVTKLWSRYGQRGSSWYAVSLNVQLSADKQLQMIAVRGNGYLGDIAIDNIRVTSSKC